MLIDYLTTPFFSRENPVWHANNARQMPTDDSLPRSCLHREAQGELHSFKNSFKNWFKNRADLQHTI